MSAYPDLRPALPTNFVNKSRTAKCLTPGIVFGAVGILGVIGVVGIAIAGSVFAAHGVSMAGVNAAQVFVVMASLLSIVYVGFHLVAAVGNEPVGVIRPPLLRVHAICFIIARLAVLLWLIAMVISIINVSNPSICLRGSRSCKLQVVGAVGSSLAFVTLGMILTALESCHYPFQAPEFLDVHLINVRISAFGSDIDALDRSISQMSLYPDENVYAREKPRELNHKSSVKRKTVPPKKTTSIPGEWPQENPERRITPLLPMVMPAVHRSRSRGWGEEWIIPMNDLSTRKKIMKRSDSAISMSNSSSGDGRSSSGYARSSSGYARSSSGYLSTSDSDSNSRISKGKRPVNRRTVTPSSSISNLNRRSPLSTMRSAEFPEVAVRPDLRYSPPIIPPPHEWRLSRTASLSQLLPVADIYTLQRRSSNTPAPLRLSGLGKALPSIPGSPTIRRKSVALRIPGAYVDTFHERALDDHLRKIEVDIHRRQSQQGRKPLGPVKEPKDKRPRSGNSRRYREKPALRESISAPTFRPDSTLVMEAVKVEYIKGAPRRRLSLGDISSEFGKMWEN